MPDDFKLRLLGSVEVERAGARVRHFGSRKALALLCYLAVRAQPIPRDTLADLFWRNRTQVQGHANLSWSLNQIVTYCPGCIDADRQQVAFMQNSPCWLDTIAFEELRRQANLQAWAAAAALYRGEFMAGFSGVDSPDFESWLLAQQETWRRRAVQVFDGLSTYHGALCDHEQAINYARRVLEIEPWREESHRQIMVLLARSGQRGAALSQYESCRRIIMSEMGVEPDASTRAVWERIRAGDWIAESNSATVAPARIPMDPVGARSAPSMPLEPASKSPPHVLISPELPVPLTPFLGREEELTELSERIGNPDYRLLTLVGPGGIGKTRLALEAALASAGCFKDGLCWVTVRPGQDCMSLWNDLAEILGRPLSGWLGGWDPLLEHLSRREMLLVLDGLDDLAGLSDFATSVLALLRRSPGLQILVTARRQLDLQAEDVFRVAGLPVPPVDCAQGIESYAAVRLFVERARRINKLFSLAGASPPVVADICRRLAGVPLAIELAAAQAATHSCSELRAALPHNLDLLHSVSLDVAVRHRSLRAVFEDSWRLLTAEERRAALALSVCRAKFTMAAALDVSAASSTVIDGLISKSILQQDALARFWLHELVAPYLAEKLTANPVLANEVRLRHALHFTGQ